MAAARITFDDEKLVVLVLHVGRVNAQAVQDGRLQKGLHLIAPLRQKDEQRGQNEEPHHVQHERLPVNPCMTSMIVPTMNNAKATMRSNSFNSAHFCRNVGKMLSKEAIRRDD